MIPPQCPTISPASISYRWDGLFFLGPPRCLGGGAGGGGAVFKEGVFLHVGITNTFDLHPGKEGLWVSL